MSQHGGGGDKPEHNFDAINKMESAFHPLQLLKSAFGGGGGGGDGGGGKTDAQLQTVLDTALKEPIYKRAFET